MTSEEIKIILENHKHWLNEDCEGWENMKADFQGANFWGANLQGADFQGANFQGANLQYADFQGADFQGANFQGANFWDANFQGANLQYADFQGADFWGANFQGANFWGANLQGADFQGANLQYADFQGANLQGANFQGANLQYADFQGAITDENTIINFPIACPDTGIFTAWKTADRKIIQLEIPVDAKRLSATGRKCRCNKAKVIAIQNIDGTDSGLTEIRSNHDNNFIYRLGEMVTVNDFDENRWKECSTGIHFFITRQEAVEYI